jgi:hypothetical protein
MTPPLEKGAMPFSLKNSAPFRKVRNRSRARALPHHPFMDGLPDPPRRMRQTFVGTIATSDPSCAWISTAFSGVRRCQASRCDLKRTLLVDRAAAAEDLITAAVGKNPAAADEA